MNAGRSGLSAMRCWNSGEPTHVLAQVAALNLNNGQQNSLTTKLQAAQQALANENTMAAENQLHAFINQLNALVNSHRLGEITADSLVSEADNLVELIS